MTSENKTTLPTLRINGRAPQGGGAFSIAITGDICPQLRGQERIEAGEEGAILAPILPFLADANLRIVQWETTLTSNPKPIRKSGPNLNCTPASARLAAAGGFELALLANNHIGDQGKDAVGETIEHLSAVGVRSVGAGANLDAAEAPAVFDIGGRTVAVLNFAENEFGAATHTSAGFAPLSPLRNLGAIRQAAEQYDFVIVTLHGGHERNPFPSPRMQELFRAYAEAGASVVFNCHTHCPEGIEFHKGTPIVYSPGNLYFPWGDAPDQPGKVWSTGKMWWTGYLPKFHFDAGGCYSVEILPYTFTPDEVIPLTPSGFVQFKNYFEEICQPLSNPEQLQALFEAWSSHNAEGYLKKILQRIPENWLDNLESPEVFLAMLSLRNQFLCESHADMTRCYLRLIEEGRLEQARLRLPALQAYQNPSW